MKDKSKSIDHSGSSFDEFLREEGVLEEAEAVAIKRVIAWQLRREMQRKRITKKVMAGRLRTSRSQLDRLLDPQYAGVTLGMLSRAAMGAGQASESPGNGSTCWRRGHLRKRPGRAAFPVKSRKLAVSQRMTFVP